jgi:hypothetical protein
MERLVRAYVANHSETVDPYNIPEEEKADYVIDFANDWERLAFAICPNMFMKSEPAGNAAPPSEDTPSFPDFPGGELNQ